MSMSRYCHRCKERVYYAEERRALDYSWHKSCFTCALCDKALDPARVEEHRELDDIYCGPCYRRNFVTGYGTSRAKVTATKTCNCCPKYVKRTCWCPNLDRLDPDP